MSEEAVVAAVPGADLVPGPVKKTMKEVGATSGDLWMVPRGDIRVLDGFNIRSRNTDHEAHIKALAASIKANGFMRDKPLAGYVSADGIVLTDGHCRLEAVDALIAAGEDAFPLPMVVKPTGTSAEDLTVALVTSNSGKPLSPLEVATVAQRLRTFGWDDKTIASRLGRTVSSVRDLAVLSGAPAAIRKMVETGKVGASLAVATIREEGTGALAALKDGLTQAETNGKTKATAKTVRAAKEAAGKPAKASKARDKAETVESHTKAPRAQRTEPVSAADIVATSYAVDFARWFLAIPEAEAVSPAALDKTMRRARRELESRGYKPGADDAEFDAAAPSSQPELPLNEPPASGAVDDEYEGL